MSWNIEQEKVGGRPAKLNEKKGDTDLEREIKKNKGDLFFGREQHCSDGDKRRNASGHQCKVKMGGSEKIVKRNRSPALPPPLSITRFYILFE